MLWLFECGWNAKVIDISIVKPHLQSLPSLAAMCAYPDVKYGNPADSRQDNGVRCVYG